MTRSRFPTNLPGEEVQEHGEHYPESLLGQSAAACCIKKMHEDQCGSFKMFFLLSHILVIGAIPLTLQSYFLYNTSCAFKVYSTCINLFNLLLDCAFVSCCFTCCSKMCCSRKEQ